MRRTPVIEGNEKGVELVDNALLGGGSARLRLDAHFETLDAIGLIGGGTTAGAFRYRPREYPRRSRAGGLTRPAHLREGLVHSSVVAAGLT